MQIARWKWVVVLAIAGLIAFVAGRRYNQHAAETAGGGDASTTRRAASDSESPRSVSEHRRRQVAENLAKFKHVLARAGSSRRGQVSAEITETAVQREARHARTLASLPPGLGLSAHQEKELLFLDDSAYALHQGLKHAFQSGAEGHDEFVEQTWEAKRVMYGELAKVLTADQFRHLTGMEPWADPLEYLTTGKGVAVAHDNTTEGSRESER